MDKPTTAEELYNLIYAHTVIKFDPSAGICCCQAFIDRLAALSPQREDTGEYVMVPREPTDAMREAGADKLFGTASDAWGDWNADAATVWSAMLAVAPSASNKPPCDHCKGHRFLVMAPSTCSEGGEWIPCPKCNQPLSTGAASVTIAALSTPEASVAELVERPMLCRDIVPAPISRPARRQVSREIEMSVPYTMVAIWSGEHRAYWRRGPTGQGNGYTTDANRAGKWARFDAELMTKHCDPDKMIALHDRPGDGTA